jgi:hypothetical protein
VGWRGDPDHIHFLVSQKFKLTPWRRNLFGKLMVYWSDKEIPAFMEPERSFSCLQELTASLHHKPDKSEPRYIILQHRDIVSRPTKPPSRRTIRRRLSATNCSTHIGYSQKCYKHRIKWDQFHVLTSNYIHRKKCKCHPIITTTHLDGCVGTNWRYVTMKIKYDYWYHN